jgi:hypothetical protein
MKVLPSQGADSTNASPEFKDLIVLMLSRNMTDLQQVTSSALCGVTGMMSNGQRRADIAEIQRRLRPNQRKRQSNFGWMIPRRLAGHSW